MRNKIRQLMKKEEGFTLVELLAVIVILGVIVAISIPSIGGIIDRANTDADAAEEALIIDAARLYEIGEEVTITNDPGVKVSVLKSEGYLEERGEGELPAGTVTRDSETSELKFAAD